MFNKRVTVTGGAGFLGSCVCQKLRDLGAEVFVPLIEEYDLTQLDDIRRLYEAARPEMVIHLAAKVGGIGVNRLNPGSFFYDNLMMGVQLLHQGYLRGIEKFVAVATICAYPKFAPTP
jgi:GDP-L-fucose synthase